MPFAEKEKMRLVANPAGYEHEGDRVFNPGELVSCMRMTPVVASAEPSGHRNKRIQVEEENCK